MDDIIKEVIKQCVKKGFMGKWENELFHGLDLAKEYGLQSMAIQAY